MTKENKADKKKPYQFKKTKVVEVVKIEKPDNIYGINERQRAFAEYYLTCREGAHSYRMAYGKDLGKEVADSTARVNSHKLLRNPKVAKYIDDRLAETNIDRPLEPEEILVELSRTALDRKAKDSDRLKAIELLGKSRAMWSNGENDGLVDINVNLTGLDDLTAISAELAKKGK